MCGLENQVMDTGKLTSPNAGTIASLDFMFTALAPDAEVSLKNLHYKLALGSSLSIGQALLFSIHPTKIFLLQHLSHLSLQ